MAAAREIFDQAVKALPEGPAAAANIVMEKEQWSREARLFAARAAGFSGPAAAMFAGIIMNAEASNYFDEALTRHFDRTGKDQDRFLEGGDTATPFPEVVVGSGLHAAIYCAGRVARGFPPPIVLEQSARVGGAFAVSARPSIYLNSRNRPGGLGLPGTPDALNRVPGAPVQPSDLGGDEYQTNAALAWPIRLSLAMYARVMPNVTVDMVAGLSNDEAALLLADGREMRAKRVIVATGLGYPVTLPGLLPGSKRVITFAQLMRQMDEPFPLRGMRRCAVIGAGDSGKTAIEMLTGQGPVRHLSVASLDWAERIDWYGVPRNCSTRNGWENTARSRYKGIARLLPDGRFRERLTRVQPFNDRVDAIAEGCDSVYVNDRSYDQVVLALGYQGPTLASPGRVQFTLGGRVVASVALDGPIFAIGTAANIPITQRERDFFPAAEAKQNAVAMWRLAPRTAALAAALN